MKTLNEYITEHSKEVSSPDQDKLIKLLTIKDGDYDAIDKYNEAWMKVNKAHGDKYVWKILDDNAHGYDVKGCLPLSVKDDKKNIFVLGIVSKLNPMDGINQRYDEDKIKLFTIDSKNKVVDEYGTCNYDYKKSFWDNVMQLIQQKKDIEKYFLDND